MMHAIPDIPSHNNKSESVQYDPLEAWLKPSKTFQSRDAYFLGWEFLKVGRSSIHCATAFARRSVPRSWTNRTRGSSLAKLWSILKLHFFDFWEWKQRHLKSSNNLQGLNFLILLGDHAWHHPGIGRLIQSDRQDHGWQSDPKSQWQTWQMQPLNAFPRHVFPGWANGETFGFTEDKGQFFSGGNLWGWRWIVGIQSESGHFTAFCWISVGFLWWQIPMSQEVSSGRSIHHCEAMWIDDWSYEKSRWGRHFRQLLGTCSRTVHWVVQSWLNNSTHTWIFAWPYTSSIMFHWLYTPTYCRACWARNKLALQRKTT